MKPIDQLLDFEIKNKAFNRLRRDPASEHRGKKGYHFKTKYEGKYIANFLLFKVFI